MDYNKYRSLDFSILYRSMHKYYDLALTDLDISAGQVTFLIVLSQKEGISLVDIANICSYDKGTVTKGIQKLEEKGYVKEEESLDKRAKLLYLTEKAKQNMSRLHMVIRDWWEYLTSDVSPAELEVYLNVQAKLANKARKYNFNQEDEIKFFGLQKSTLLDYPTKLAATIFTGGCNFCCPFCHNSDLVYLDEGIKEIKEADILEYLAKRKNILDGVCISGGEPLLHKGLVSFITKVKNLGLLVKLDTNGFLYDELKKIIDLKLVDYVAMDIKNSPSKYGMTCGVKNIDLTNIYKSVELLKSDVVDYEFRTTIVEEYHDINDIKEIGLWLNGAKNYYLQSFRNGENVIDKTLHSHNLETLEKYKKELEKNIKNVGIRGV